MAFPYRKVLMIGASSGIGHGIAERLIENGSQVIVLGRRKEKLDGFVQKFGAEKVTSIVFDISRGKEISSCVKTIISAHPDLDCVFLNAGIQSAIDFTKPEKLEISEFLMEIDVNLTSLVTFTYCFLPFLMAKDSPTSLIYTGSNLAIVPAPKLPAYSASKAALNVFVLCLREQLRDVTDSQLRIIELSPPPVQTELHDKQMGPEAGRKMGMPLKEFVDKSFQGFESGSDQIVIGSVGPANIFNEIIDKRRAAMENLATMMRGGKIPGQK